MTPTWISMVSLSGREALTVETINAYWSRGGLTFLPFTLFYSAPNGTHRGLVVPANCKVVKVPHDGMLPDFWRILRAVPDGHDWLFLEDDCSPCANAIHRMTKVVIPDDVGLLSFFDMRNQYPSPGLYRAPRFRHLWGSQAMKIPARVVPLLRAYADEGRMFSTGWDTWAGLAVNELGLHVAHYSPSLVQHTGFASVAFPADAKRPTANNYPGDDFDALGPCPDPIVPGTWESNWNPAEHPNWCTFHGGFHLVPGASCPGMKRRIA